MGAVLLLVAYGLGTLPTAIVIGRGRGVDPTASGSGNPGATNVYRTAGRRAGAIVLGGDLVKGALAAALGWWAIDRTFGLLLGGAAVVGHVFPLQRRFRGGKGVATAAGAALVVHPIVTLVLGALFGVVARVSGRPSIASMAIAALWPVGAALRGRPVAEVLIAAAVGGLVIVRHESNIRRLLERTEPRLER